jgi:hypothetical protein
MFPAIYFAHLLFVRSESLGRIVDFITNVIHFLAIRICVKVSLMDDGRIKVDTCFTHDNNVVMKLVVENELSRFYEKFFL